MHVGHKLDTKYYVNEQDGKMELSAVHEEKDLGVYFTSDLKPSTVYTAAAKARRIIAMMRRNFKRLDKEDFLVIYKTYICCSLSVHLSLMFLYGPCRLN